MWEVMFWPIVACVLLPWLLVYLGLHVVQRGIIFVDIAMAANGLARDLRRLLFHFDLHGWTLSHRLGFTILGARFFRSPENAPVRFRRKQSSDRLCGGSGSSRALAQPRGGRGRRNQTNAGGEYSAGDTAEVWKCFALFVFVGIFHFLLRRNFLLVSFDRTAPTSKVCASVGGIFPFTPASGWSLPFSSEWQECSWYLAI